MCSIDISDRQDDITDILRNTVSHRLHQISILNSPHTGKKVLRTTQSEQCDIGAGELMFLEYCIHPACRHLRQESAPARGWRPR